MGNLELPVLKLQYFLHNFIGKTNKYFSKSSDFLKNNNLNSESLNETNREVMSIGKRKTTHSFYSMQVCYGKKETNS